MAIEPFSCFAIAAPGLEPLVARELRALGEQPRVEDGGVAWTGDARSLMRANLRLRVASRVVVRVASFRATQFHELERFARRIPWDRFLGVDTRATFRVTARKSKLYHTDGIAERLGRAAGAHGAREQLFVVRVVHDVFEVSADSSGNLLHMRGYRLQTAKAPLRETLAAALLLAAEWTGDRALIDPFCGSGTIPIEGALIARRIAPGMHRDFAFTRWPDHDPSVWAAVREVAMEMQLPSAAAAIQGSDRDAGAIAAATANAARANVGGDIEWVRRPVSGIARVADSGLVASNPPYGRRVSGRDDVRNVYAQAGKVWRRTLGGWTAALYASDARLVAQTGLALEQKFRTSNGGIPVGAWIGSIPAN